MHESLLLGVATVFVLGLGAQWIAWRFRFPSILLLLAFGFVAGPVTGLLAPEQLQGNGVLTKEHDVTDPEEIAKGNEPQATPHPVAGDGTSGDEAPPDSRRA